MNALTYDIKTVRVKPDGSTFSVAAGTGDTLESDILDRAGYEGVRFVLGLGAVTSGGSATLHVQQDDDPEGGTMADIEGSGQAIDDTATDTLWISEVVRPTKRYVRLVLDRADQNLVIDVLLAELFGARHLPVVADVTVGGQEVFLSPLEGTA